MLDDVAVFNGALTQSQISNVMSGDFSAFIGGPLSIVSQPQSQTVPQGATAAFSVGVTGQGPFQYQWYFNSTNELPSASNPTVTNATLVLTNVQSNQSGAYSVVVSNASAGITSQPATLGVYNATLVGLWRFNQSSGTNVLDSSGLGNNGTLAGENGNIPGWVAGQAGFGSALSFTNDGTDHAYVTIPAAPSLAIGQTATNAWTITVWAYEDSDGTSNFVANYGRMLVIDDGTAFQLESGASGDAEIYTWDRAHTEWQIGWGAYPSLGGAGASAARVPPRSARVAESGIAVIAGIEDGFAVEGLIRGDFPMAKLAQELENAGAAALSVRPMNGSFRARGRIWRSHRKRPGCRVCGKTSFSMSSSCWKRGPIAPMPCC